MGRITNSILILLLLGLAGLLPGPPAGAATTTPDETWQDLMDEAEALLGQGYPDSADVVLTGALESALNTYGKSDSTVSASFFDEGVRVRYYFRSDAEAGSLFARALRIREGIDDGDTEELARILFRLGRVLFLGGEGERALELSQRSLAIRESLLPGAHPDIGHALSQVGQIRRQVSHDYEEAVSLQERALAIFEEAYGPEHEEVSYCLWNLAISYVMAHRYDEAEIAFRRRLILEENNHGPESVEVALALSHLGSIYKRRYDYEQAIPLYERSVAIREKVSGDDDPDLAIVRENLAWIYMHLWRHAEAESLYLRALATWERTRGRESNDYAAAANKLGFLYKDMGRYAEAEPLLSSSVELSEKIYGPESPRITQRLNNLAMLHKQQGRLNDAEAILRRIIAIREESGRADPSLAIYLYNLGNICMGTSRYPEAESLFKRAMAMWEEVYGPEHADIGACYIELAFVYREVGRYQEAETALEKAGHIISKDFGTDCTEYTRIYQGLADVYLDEGRLADAEGLLDQTLAIRERDLNPDHPMLARTIESTLRLHRYKGEYEEAFQLAERAWQMRSRNFHSNAEVLSEKDALVFAADLRHAVDNYLTAYSDLAGHRGNASSQMAEVILSSKGQVSDGIFERRRSLVEETDPTTMALAERLRLVKVLLSQSYVKGPGDDPDAYRAQMDSLGNVVNGLESDLARQSASFRRRQEAAGVSVEKVTSLLPENTALLEFVRYDYFELNPEQPVPHYMVSVMRPAADVMLIEMGEALPIDKLIDRLREHLLGLASAGKLPNIVDQQEYSRLSGELYKIVWEPVAAAIMNAQTVLIAPDGALNLVAFAGLKTPDDECLIEKHALHYLSAGRDLLRLSSSPEIVSGLFALGDPDYGASADNRMAAVSAPRDTVVEVAFVSRNLRSSCAALNEIEVAPLPGSRREVDLISEIWESTTLEPLVACYGDEASEEFFKAEAPGNRVIHLATHGYFLGGACRPEETGADYAGENPLLLSGLFFAGANLHGAGADSLGAEDGILTAYEVSAMDLEGTEMVVLSACETGLGEVKDGEGVYGLRRAFQMAGARTVVSALWPVSDEATAGMMAQLYAREDESLPEAMRRVQLERIMELRSEGSIDHPFTWGAFIALGDWR